MHQGQVPLATSKRTKWSRLLIEPQTTLSCSSLPVGDWRSSPKNISSPGPTTIDKLGIPARPQLFWRSSQRRSAQKPSDWAGNQISKRWIRFTRNLRPDIDFSSATKRMYSRMNLTKRLYLEPCALDCGFIQIPPTEFLWAL